MLKIKLGVHLRDPLNENFDLEYIQFFVIGPQNYTTVSWLNTREKRMEFRKDPRKKIVHGSYVDYPWGGNKIAIYNIKRELRICKEIGAIGLIVHIPSNSESIDNMIDKLLDSKPKNVKLILEINARGGWAPSEINSVLKVIHKKSRRGEVSLCLDTAHLWSAGIDLTTAKDVKTWISKIKHPELIGLIHLNDNRNPLGGKRDIHDSLVPGVGQIWKYDNSGLKEILRIFSKIPVILERSSFEKKKLIEEIKYVNELTSI